MLTYSVNMDHMKNADDRSECKQATIFGAK